MKIDSFPFESLHWSSVPKEEISGESGKAYSQTHMMNEIRVRKVEYSAGYKADHWCSKGHIIFCIDGEMDTELKDGRIMKLLKGMTYFVGDNNEAHRTSTKTGCKLFIVD